MIYLPISSILSSVNYCLTDLWHLINSKIQVANTFKKTLFLVEILEYFVRHLMGKIVRRRLMIDHGTDNSAQMV